jgi:hypothetical protein
MRGAVVIDGWLMTPAPAARLALFRIMMGVFSAGYLVARLPMLFEMGDETRVGWEPVGVLWWLADPLPRWAMRCAVLATIAWLDGDTLRNHVAYSATRLRVLGGTPSPLAGPMMKIGWLFTPLAVATLVVELGAPLALLVTRLRVPWVALAWCMHVAIAATMFVVFPYPLALIAFAPLFRLERLLPAQRNAEPSTRAARH